MFVFSAPAIGRTTRTQSESWCKDLTSQEQSPQTTTGANTPRRSLALAVILLCDVATGVIALIPSTILALLAKNYLIGPRDPTMNDDPTSLAVTSTLLLIGALLPAVITNMFLGPRTRLPAWLLALIAIGILIVAVSVCLLLNA